MSRLPAGECRYIGDGVYVSHDSYQMWLRVNDHRNEPLVALEPSVFFDLIKTAGDIFDPKKVATALRAIADEMDPHHEDRLI